MQGLFSLFLNLFRACEGGFIWSSCATLGLPLEAGTWPVGAYFLFRKMSLGSLVEFGSNILAVVLFQVDFKNYLLSGHSRVKFLSSVSHRGVEVADCRLGRDVPIPFSARVSG